MPELPEVETVTRDLRPMLVGRTLGLPTLSTHALRTEWNPAWARAIRGASVVSISRRGKWIIVELSTAARLLIHLGMTGQLTVVPQGEPVPDHLHFQVKLKPDPTELRFRDIRRFGSIQWFATGAELDDFLKDRLGPEPFDIDRVYFRTALRRTGRSLKAALLDQTIVAGVGNIYADEACHRAGLHPGAVSASLSGDDADRLCTAIETVLSAAVAGRGSTIRDYVGGSGLRGTFQTAFAVYGRTGEPCLKCSTPIVVARYAGRSSHWCPVCQPIVPRPE